MREYISVLLSHRKCGTLLWQPEETNILSIISHSEGGSCSHASQPALESLPSVDFLFLFITIMCNCPEWLYSEQEKPLSKTCGTFQHIKDLSHPLSWKDPPPHTHVIPLCSSFLSAPRRERRCTYSIWNVSYKAIGGRQPTVSLPDSINSWRNDLSKRKDLTDSAVL